MFGVNCVLTEIWKCPFRVNDYVSVPFKTYFFLLPVSMDTKNNDFVEALQYSYDRAVIMTGNFCDTYETGKVN